MASSTIVGRIPYNVDIEAKPRLRKTQTRAEQVSEVIDEALMAYRDVLMSDLPLRELSITVKMREDGRGVRAVLVNVQGELQFCIRARVDEPAQP